MCFLPSVVVEGADGFFQFVGAFKSFLTFVLNRRHSGLFFRKRLPEAVFRRFLILFHLLQRLIKGKPLFFGLLGEQHLTGRVVYGEDSFTARAWNPEMRGLLLHKTNYTPPNASSPPIGCPRGARWRDPFRAAWGSPSSTWHQYRPLRDKRDGLQQTPVQKTTCRGRDRIA